MFTLSVQKRTEGVKPKNLRKQGKLPAVFYGRKEKTTPIEIAVSEFLKVWKEAGESSVISLKHGGKDLSALIHDVHVDPVRGEPLHADFYIVEADKEVEVSVPLVFVGISPAVKEQGATLVKVLHELEVTGLPKDLPHEIEIPITPLLALDDQILAREVKLPAGIALATNPEEVVALVSLAKEEEETPAEFDASQVEVEEKGKKEEDSEPTEGEKKEKKE